ncbi:MAG: HAD-IIIA family hydrolase [Candidatus Hydrogenedentota bacterium]|nr:MAG: HAD-IIIA family hydrolase [Candidatus Hydrogenedentota bacterium]
MSGNTTTKHRTVLLLDRDGVINIYRPGRYVNEPEDFEPVPDLPASLGLLRATGSAVVVVSNQAGVGKGLMSAQALERVTEKMRALFAEARVPLLDVLYCPHSPDQECSCRKPRPGLILEAAPRHNLSLDKTWFIGDSHSDLEAARAAGCSFALVTGGKTSAEEIKEWSDPPDITAPTLHDAVWIILGHTAPREEPYFRKAPTYEDASRRMRDALGSLPRRILIAHHGDCDGITGAALLTHWLEKSGREVAISSRAEFRDEDLAHFEKAGRSCEAGVFLEAQGMPPSYLRLASLFLNIDHHPHPDRTPIPKMLNPRDYGFDPCPCVTQVIFELLGDDLPEQAAAWTAIAATADYCIEPARDIIARHAPPAEMQAELIDTFLAIQYVEPLATKAARFLAPLPSFEEFLSAEPFVERRNNFRRELTAAIEHAHIGKRTVIAITEPGEFRLASPLANRLQDLHPDHAVISVELSSKTARYSVRNRSTTVPLGALLADLTARMGCGDGTGHEKAGSARVPRERHEEFLEHLKRALGEEEGEKKESEE